LLDIKNMEAIANLLNSEHSLWDGTVEDDALEHIQRAALLDIEHQDEIYHALLSEWEHRSFAPEPNRSRVYDVEFGTIEPHKSWNIAY
jgi:hypothetical protein